MTEQNKGSLFLQLAWKIVVFCLLVFIIGCFFTDWTVWGKGVLFGGLFTLLRLRLMDLSVRRAVMQAPHKASGYFTRQYILRYLMSAAVLIVAALEPSISLYGTMAAMISLKVATYVQGFFEKPAPKDGSVQFEEWIDEEEDEDEDWDRWQTYNLKARRKQALKNHKLYNARLKNPETEDRGAEEKKEDDGEQLSLFDDQE